MEVDMIDDFDQPFEPTVSVPNLPKPVGSWTLHNGFNPVIFHMYRKPRWITRYLVRVLFEITWKDAENASTLL